MRVNDITKYRNNCKIVGVAKIPIDDIMFNKWDGKVIKGRSKSDRTMYITRFVNIVGCAEYRINIGYPYPSMKHYIPDGLAVLNKEKLVFELI